MSASTSCPHCAAPVKVADRLAGKRIRCPKCQEAFRVPARESDEPDDEERTTMRPGNRRKTRTATVDEPPVPRQSFPFNPVWLAAWVFIGVVVLAGVYLIYAQSVVHADWQRLLSIAEERRQYLIDFGHTHDEWRVASKAYRDLLQAQLDTMTIADKQKQKAVLAELEKKEPLLKKQETEKMRDGDRRRSEMNSHFEATYRNELDRLFALHPDWKAEYDKRKQSGK
jgi:hypothetical protein